MSDHDHATDTTDDPRAISRFLRDPPDYVGSMDGSVNLASQTQSLPSLHRISGESLFSSRECAASDYAVIQDRDGTSRAAVPSDPTTDNIGDRIDRSALEIAPSMLEREQVDDTAVVAAAAACAATTTSTAPATTAPSKKLKDTATGTSTQVSADHCARCVVPSAMLYVSHDLFSWLPQCHLRIAHSQDPDAVHNALRRHIGMRFVPYPCDACARVPDDEVLAWRFGLPQGDNLKDLVIGQLPYGTPAHRVAWVLRTAAILIGHRWVSVSVAEQVATQNNRGTAVMHRGIHRAKASPGDFELLQKYVHQRVLMDRAGMWVALTLGAVAFLAEHAQTLTKEWLKAYTASLPPGVTANVPRGALTVEVPKSLPPPCA
jgi:hypothetical protein